MNNLLRARYAIGLLAVEGLFVLLHFQFGHLRLFNLDREYNLPTWFSGIQLAALAAVCLVCFHREAAAARLRWLWWLFAAGFLYLSFDEIMVVHERVLREETLAALPAASLLRGIPPWQIVFLPVAAVSAVVAVLFFRPRFQGRPGNWIPALIGVALWGAAFSLEGMASAVFMSRGWYQAEVAFEELFEMAGATFLLLGLARYAASPLGVVSVAGARTRRPLAWAAVLGLFLALPVGAVLMATLGERAVVHRMSGKRLQSAGDYRGAMEAFSAVLEENPDDLEALRGLGQAAYRDSDLEAAEDAFLKVVALDPEDDVARNALDLLRVKRRRSGSVRR